MTANNNSNYVIKESGIDGLTKAIDRIYKMPDNEYKSMRRTSCKHAENFNIKQMVEGYEKTYLDVLGIK